MSVSERAIVADVSARQTPLQLLRRGLVRNEVITIIALLLLAIIAWGWTLHLTNSMETMADMPQMQRMPDANALHWDAPRARSTFAMWSVMMFAMMLPSAMPIILLHRRVGAHQHAQNNAVEMPPTSLLVLGYLLVWTGFSVAATLAQIGLSMTAQITPMMTLVEGRFGGAILLFAGIYQLTPLKQHCLTLCRSPLVFLTQHYRSGSFGALRMGVMHGWFCLGCCWAAMALLFVGGVMNPLWIAGLTVFVLIEKILPLGKAIGQLLGVAAIATGIYWLVNF